MTRQIISTTTFGGRAGTEANGGQTLNGFNLKLTTQTDVEPVTDDELLSEAYRSLLYRGGAAVVLGLYPKGTKSSDVPYDADKAVEIDKVLTKWFKDNCPNKRGVAYLKAIPDGRIVTMEVTEYVLGEGSEPAFAKVKAFITDWLSKDATRTVEQFATKRELVVPKMTSAIAAVEADPANGVEAEEAVAATTWQDDKEFLAAANVWYTAKMKAVAAAMAAAE